MLQVAGTLGYDAAPDIVLCVDPYGATEWVQLQSFTPSSVPTAHPAITTGTLPPFPGTVGLLTGVSMLYPHLAGTPVQPYFLEYVMLRGGSMETWGGEFALTQEGQIAMAHAPQGSTGSVVRRGVLKGYPIIQIASMQIVYPWANDLEPTPVDSLYIEFAKGSFRFPIGYFTPDKSVAQTTYLGGFTTMPEQVIDAVVSEAMALMVRRFAPYGASNVSSKGESYSFSDGKSMYSMDAERALGPLRNLVPY